MKKKLSYRDKLLELAYIYNVKEIQDYTKSRLGLGTAWPPNSKTITV